MFIGCSRQTPHVHTLVRGRLGAEPPSACKSQAPFIITAARRSPLAHGVLGTTHAWTDGQIRCPASPPVPPPAQSLAPGKRTLKPWSPCPCSKHPEPQKILPWRLLLVALPLGHSVGEVSVQLRDCWSLSRLQLVLTARCSRSRGVRTRQVKSASAVHRRV